MNNLKDILYTYKDNVYVNITNKCPCACTFCIRSQKDAIGSANSLWLEHNPDFDEVKSAIDSFDFTGYNEIIFCGYGEPTNAFELLIKVAQYIRSKMNIKIRVNTNGLGSLINERDISQELCQNVDAVSISLNCSNEEEYYKVVRPKFGIKSYSEMLDFAGKCKQYTNDVKLSVVDVIGEEEIAKCQKIADDLGIELRVRKFSN
ncbi:MAG: TIGR04100 family radical SAM protein [Ruminococcus sp.]|nr:TIGR04100 family radical SAM protein [Ruminococcus sp.]